METFLDNLKRRGCKFHVLWFDDHEGLCIPASAKQPEAYLLTRTVLIKHLARHGVLGGKLLSFQFPSMESAGYDQYIKENAVYFFLCLNGRATFGAMDGIKCTEYLGIVYRLGLRGYSVGFLETLEFVSSKVRDYPLLFMLTFEVASRPSHSRHANLGVLKGLRFGCLSE